MINQRIFGASISDKVQEELNKRQSGTGEIEFGESVKIPQSVELNSRTPFIRMWTAVKLIEPHQVKDKLLQLNAAGEVSRDKAGKPKYTDIPAGLTKERTEHGGYMRYKKDGSNSYVAFTEIGDTVIQNFVSQEKMSDITRNQINHAQKIYTIGNYNQKQDYATIKPNESTQETEVFFDTESSENPLLKPQTGIKSITSETEGSLGLTKTTTVEFTVHNFYDYDRIYNKYFLKPGARIFVDFGWSDIDNLYEPNDLIDSKNSKGGIQEFLYGEKDVGDEVEGVVTKNAGNFEVINGIVTDYNSKMMPDGSVECQVTLVSSNSALLSFKNDDETCTQVERMLDVGVYYLALQRVIDSLPADSEEREQLNKFLVPDATTSAETKEIFEENLRINAAGVFQLNDIYLKEYETEYLIGGKPALPIEVGLIIDGKELDDAYICWGLFEDYIINNTFGHGTSPDEINNDSNSIRLDSSSEFTAWSKSINESHKELFKADSGERPDFLWPQWWGTVGPPESPDVSSYNWQKNKYPKESYPQWPETDNEPLMWAGGYNYDKYKFDDEFGRIPIRECFVKTKIIKKVFTGNKGKPIKKIIEALLKKINEMSDGLFNWRLVAGNTESQAKIIDINYTQDEMVKQEAIQNKSNTLSKFFTFNVMSPNSMVKNFNLEFKLPGGGIGDMYAIKGMSPIDTIDSNDPRIIRLAGVESIDKDNLNTIYLPDDGSFRAQQRLKKDSDVESFNVYNQVDDLLNVDSSIKVSKYGIQNNNSNPIRRDLYAGVPETAIGKVNGKVTPKTDPILYNNQILKENGFIPCNSLKEYYSNNMKVALKTKQIDLLPYTLELNIYGISSIVPGDTFKVDYLPKAHLENTFLQTVKVSHKVDSSGWDTTLQTQYRPFYPENKGDIFNSIVKNKGTSRLSPSCMIKELNIALGDGKSPRQSRSGLTSGRDDEHVDLEQFMKYITDVTIEKQTDATSELAFIVHFKTTDLIEELWGKYNKWKGMIHHFNTSFYCVSQGYWNDVDENSILTQAGFNVVEDGFFNGTGVMNGSLWMNQYSEEQNDLNPDLIVLKEKSSHYGKVTKFFPPACQLYPNTHYRMWVYSTGAIAILRANEIIGDEAPGAEEESDRYIKLKKLFQKNTKVHWKDADNPAFGKKDYLDLSNL